MTSVRAQQLYEEDFYAWTQLQAKELRRFAEAAARLPEHCPYTLEQVLGDFWPTSPGDGEGSS